MATKRTKQPTKVHHRVAKRVTLTGSTIKAMGAPHARKAKHWYERRSLWQKVGLILAAIVILLLSSMYGVAQWYIHKHADEPLQIGATFVPSYAEYYDLDPKDTLQAMIDDLGLRRFRLVSYWNRIEPEKGQYSWEELDWQFDKVEQAGGTVSLAIGLRQPRWPECHWPKWAQEEPQPEWEADLNTYLTQVVERYKDRPSLQSYQLENEYLLEAFGDCPDHSRDRLVAEYDLVKKLDPETPIIVTRSNNAVPSWPVGKPRADQIGAAVYKRVWDKTVTKRYFEYPLPAWFYSFLAGGAEITTGRDSILHELQAEAWGPAAPKDMTIAEQDKSLSAEDLPDRIQYGVDTGMRTVDLWGVEWWYWRKMKLNDPSLWEAGKAKIKELTTLDDKQCSNYYAKPIDGNRSKSPC
jgi:hypothetical protein